MNKKRNLLVVLVCLLVLSMAFVSCDNGTTKKGEYLLEWGTTYTSPSDITSAIYSQGWDVEMVQTGVSVYATGNTATAIYNYSRDMWYFEEGGEEDGSFEDLLNYTKEEGKGLPDNLKDALRAQKDNVPLAGIYNTGSFVVVFYISKN
jgi:hypothetical protein